MKILLTIAIALCILLQPFSVHAKGGKGGITPQFNVVAKTFGISKPQAIKSPVVGIGPKSPLTKPVSLVKKVAPVTAQSVNGKVALQRKLSGLSSAENRAAKARTLADGRVRYYTKETPARRKGKTRGASFVTEHSPRTGRVRQWMESYGQKGQVLRVHPKSLNGQQLKSTHFPPTAREKGK